MLHRERAAPKGTKRKSRKVAASTTEDSPAKNTRNMRVKKAKIKKRPVVDL
jgi:hypothetical protein